MLDRYGRIAATIIACTCLLAGGGCGRRPMPAATTASRTSAMPLAQDPISLSDVGPPALQSREWSLPPGCVVTSVTERIAAYTRNTGTSYPHAVFGLLDLDSGERREVLPSPVSSARRFEAFAPRISDTWIAWEEVSPNEASAPRAAEWRLYAAPLDGAALRIGEARLIDEGTTDYRLRPMYALAGSALCWTVNTVPTGTQEYVTRSGSVFAVDLDSGTRRTLFTSASNVPTLRMSNRASGALAVITEVATSGPAPCSQVAHAIDIAGGMVVDSAPLDNRFALSHLADFLAGRFSWAAFDSDDAEWPVCYLRDRDRPAVPVSASAVDPTFFGSFLVYESIESSGAGGLGLLQKVRGVRLVDPATRTRTMLAGKAEQNDDAGWWQIGGADQSRRVLVLWNDLGPWLDDQSKARTLVRVFRLPRPERP